MNKKRHQRISDLVFEASKRSGIERAAFLESECGEDRRLRAEVEELVQLHDEENGLRAESVARGLLKQLAGLQGDGVWAHPERVGQFRILGILGEGGMGIVYEAEQDTPKRRVALKLLRPTFLTEKARRRFEFETEVLGRLQHPGIAQIFEAGTADTGFGPQPYFAMERIEGLLLTHFAEEQQLGTRQRVKMFVHICEAVDHAHQKGVIHRDLKPSNILVDRSGQPKVLDFGIARATDSDLQTTTMQTDVGQLIGTIAYMSPEQAAGAPEDLDTRSDVYALGVIFYELLAGCKPYNVSDKLIHEAARVIREDEPTPLSSVRKEYRGDLETISKKALEKERERRYGSAQELAADLIHHLRNEPIVAQPPSFRYRVRKFTARNKTVVGGVAGVVVSLAMGLVVALFLFQQSLKNEVEANANARAARENEAKEREQRILAEARLKDIERLSDMKTLRELEVRAERLWPAHPRNSEAYEHWLDEAEELAHSLTAHRESLAQLERRAKSSKSPDDATSTLVFSTREEAWWHDTLQVLVAALETFVDPDPRVGAKADIAARRDAASTIWQRSIGGFEEEWEDAVFFIADSDSLQVTYGNIEFKPQIGLVPIGPDPETGLWEFWHVESGERPARDEKTGKLVIAGETGMVLVLLPGGTFTMGAQAHDPNGPNYDPDADKVEGPVQEVTLSAFFVSKFEMTQGQWLRTLGENPSYYQTDAGNTSVSAANPVETVSRIQCCEALARYGMVLPTEAQWEYGARAGTSGPWWTGPKKDSVGQKAAGNLADMFARENGAPESWGRFELWSDGATAHAKVGTYAPNAFGLHDVIGNVWEWCRDGFVDYRRLVTGEEGLRVVDWQNGPRNGISRGGGFNDAAILARSSLRLGCTPENRTFALGLRAARTVDP